MSVHCLTFPCFTPCKQCLILWTFTNGEETWAHQNFFWDYYTQYKACYSWHPWDAGIGSKQPGQPACKLQGVQPGPYPAPLPARSMQDRGQQLPYTQQTLKHLSSAAWGQGWVAAPCTLHLARAPSQAQHSHQTSGHLLLPTAAPGLSFPLILCLKPAPFSGPGSRGIAVRAWVMLFELQ